MEPCTAIFRSTCRANSGHANRDVSIGAGGPLIHVKTTNGGVKLDRL
jgi:hypothetical protein